MHMSRIAVPHTSTAFDAELGEVRALIGRMAELAAGALDGSVVAMRSMDLGSAAVIVAADREIDALNEQLETAVVRTIALRAPMADDLRELIVAIRLGSQFERAGDQAKGMAKRLSRLNPDVCQQHGAIVDQMATLASAMLRDADAAFQSRDMTLARAVRGRDRELNTLFDELTAAIIRQMTADPKLVTAGSHLLSVAKQIERIGDYAAKIADNVCYMVTGEHFADWRDGPQPVGS